MTGSQTVRVLGSALLRMLSPIQINAPFFPATGTTSIVWVMKVFVGVLALGDLSLRLPWTPDIGCRVIEVIVDVQSGEMRVQQVIDAVVLEDGRRFAAGAQHFGLHHAQAVGSQLVQAIGHVPIVGMLCP